MALEDIKVAPLLSQMPIVDTRSGTPTQFFQDYMTSITKRFVEGINNLNAATQAILSASAAQTAASQATTTAAQSVAQAQASADASTTPAARSGDTMQLVNALSSGWAAGPQINLLTVSAGTLTIGNSSPNQVDSTSIADSGTFIGNWRIVEIVGAVETVVFTGTYSASRFGDELSDLQILHNNTNTSAFSLARASTGSVSYRMDLNSPDVQILNIQCYLYVRRA